MQSVRRWSSRLRAMLGGASARTKGFILILVVGGLAVLVILGLSFSEQSRVDLYGAQNSRDYLAADGVAEAGFQMALRILKEDRNVFSTDTAGTWDTKKGPGWTSRWGYNPYVNVPAADGGVMIPDGAGFNSPGAPFSHGDHKNYLDSWQMMIWNDQLIGDNAAFAYQFTFDYKNNIDRHYQRHPQFAGMLMDTWPLQPFARVKKFRVRYGNTCGLVQISITPKDGGINVNDPYDPGLTFRNSNPSQGPAERPGWHDNNNPPLYLGTKTPDKYASPDRRTLDYVLGRPPEIALRESEFEVATGSTSPDMVADKRQYAANALAGQIYTDSGVYNYRAYFEPAGRSVNPASIPSYNPAWYCQQFRSCTVKVPSEPMMFFSNSDTHCNRYNFEGTRYPLFSSTAGLSSRHWLDNGSTPALFQGSWERNAWFPTGRYKNGPLYPPATGAQAGERDSRFMGFGFDFQNPKRAGVGAALTDVMAPTIHGQSRYVGAGMYGHPRMQSFQYHFVAAVAGGRFWTDLMANWYFGGAPGYTTAMMQNMVQNWAHLGSTYDSMGIGSNWMVPSTHVWLPGFWSQGQIIQVGEVDRGLVRDPKNMPPAKPAASYPYPLNRWTEDAGLAPPHFTYMNNRTSIRATGIQENWGIMGADDPNGRFYDAVNINNSNYQVVYGLLTPEKFPSMMARSVVAPNLHWKARMLDAAYEKMETFARYNGKPYDTGDAPAAQAADRWKDAFVPYMHDKADDPTRANLPPKTWRVNVRIPRLMNNLFGKITNPGPYPAVPTVEPYDPAAPHMDPTDYKCSLHRQAPTLRSDGWTTILDGGGNPAAEWGNISLQHRIWGKMDFTTPEPLTYIERDSNGADMPPYRKGSGLPQDDVFVNTHYDLTLSPNTTEAADKLDGTAGPTNFNSSMMPRPDNVLNWADWFMQRDTQIDPKRADWADFTLFPISNHGFAGAIVYPEGIEAPGANAGGVPKGYDVASKRRIHPQTAPPADKPIAKPHPLYGLPNPNYLLLYPGSDVNMYWADQFRRYLPIENPSGPEDVTKGPPMGPQPSKYKMFDKFAKPPVPAATSTTGWDSEFLIQPGSPVPKSTDTNPAPIIPAINKDEAWRLARIGRKYQEILVDEILDYQINPWWPNPAQLLATNPNKEMCVPLDRTPVLKSPIRLKYITAVTGNKANWPSLKEAIDRGAPGLDAEVPDYYAYFNRFWMRSSSKYARPGAGGKGGIEPYSAGPLPANSVDGLGVYPKPYQYVGMYDSTLAGDLKDRVFDFPGNTLEDQLGSDYRYLATSLMAMGEIQMARAPTRNHPFKNWGDFVAFLGHLVYRAPFNGDMNAAAPTAQNDFSGRAKNGIRDYLVGVNAYVACHDPANPNVDPRNKNRFFDGSAVCGPGYETADALQGYYQMNLNNGQISTGAGGRTDKQGIVALDGFWPVSGNYGILPGPYSAGVASPTDMLYPAAPPGSPWVGGGAAEQEWRRRVDEFRGRDAAGLRIEHQYISEQAANDVLVSLSNGRIGPIDFDGNGYVEMTRKQDLPYADVISDATGKDVPAPGRNRYWDNFPWNNENGADPLVKAQVPVDAATNDIYTAANNTDRLLYGVRLKDKWQWQPVQKKEVIQDCVTLPIKFRSNTFRVTVVVELTDNRFRNTYSTHRYSRVYSRLPGEPSGNIKVHGRYTGEFLLHGQRSIGGVDPEMSWLGVE